MKHTAGPARRLRTLALAALVALAAAPPLAAQTSTGSLRGFVRDEAGAAVAGATITLRAPAQGLERRATTSEGGFYNLPGLRPGRYDLTVSRLGLAPVSRPVQVQIGQTLTLDFVLRVQAQQLEGLVVTAAPPETQTSEVATNITREQIENLPLVDRNFLDLARLAPGIRSEQTADGRRKTFAAGAMGAEAVNVFIDGASYKNDVLMGGVAGQETSRGNPFPQGAVQEFRVLTQNFKAEYQKAASAVITATTRSGTNRWEAGAFAFGVVPGMVARNAFAADRDLAAPNFRRWQAGASLGGPLVRDRVFVFGTYEGSVRREPAYVLVGPDSARAPAGLNPQQYAGRFANEFEEHLGFGKLTWLASPRHTLEASANVRWESDVTGFGGQTSRETAENIRNDVVTGVVTHRYASGGWFNEAQLSAQRYRWNPTPLDVGTIGHNYFGIIRYGGRDTRQEFTQDRISLRNDLTRSGVRWAGEHVFKAGATVDLLRYRAEKETFANPLFEYRADENYSRPFQALFGFGDPTIAADNVQFGLYVQDDWAVTPRVELNLGLRWDVETNQFNNDHVTPGALRDSLTNQLAGQFLPVVERLGGIDHYLTRGREDRPVYLGALQPRLGASWDVRGDQSTVLFGGFGVYVDRDFWNYMVDEEYRRQFKVLRIEFNETGPTPQCARCVAWDDRYFDPDELRSLSESGLAGAPEVHLIRNDSRPPKNYQWNLGVRQALGGVQLTATYTGARGYNGWAMVRATNWGALGPNYSTLFLSTDDIRTWYDALLLRIDRPYTEGARWGGSISYTLGRAEQRGEYQFSLDDRYATVEDYPRWPARPIGTNVSSDQRHTIVANGILRLPYDVMFSSVIQLGSGYPVFGTDATNGWGPEQRRTTFFSPPRRGFLGIPGAFASRNIDMRLEKGFQAPGGQRLAVVADLFNAFNLANYGCWNADIPPAGQTSNYGTANCAFEGRRVQLGVKYDFR